MQSLLLLLKSAQFDYFVCLIRCTIENIILPNRTPVNKSRCIISSLLQYCFYFRGVSAGTSYEINFVATYIITVHAQVRVFTARRYASAAFAVIACPSLCLSVRYKSVLYRNDCRDEMSWFWHRSFFPPIPHCVIRKFGYLQNLVDRVVNKTRRRRRSSLLTTPVRQSTSRGCLTL